MTENKRYVCLDDGEVYYITDTQTLKTLKDYVNEFSKPEYELNANEIERVAKEEYFQMIYENSMSATENVNALNNLYEENQHIKQTIKTMMENERTHIGKSVLKQLWEAIE